MPKITIEVTDLYETEEAAKALGIGYATLYRWIRKGKVIPLRVSGRTLVPKSEVERLQSEAESQRRQEQEKQAEIKRLENELKRLRGDTVRR